MPRTLQGVLPIVQTPFLDSGEIDFASLKREVDWAYSVGIDGLGTGMVSETLKLTASERQALAEKLVEFSAGRGSVFIAVGAESIEQALQHATAAAAADCDAVMATPPITTRVNESGLRDYYRALADAVAVPIIVQDASGYVGQSIPTSIYVELLDLYGPEKVLFKPEASPVGPCLSALRDATTGAARIFEGSGGIFLIDSFRRGIAGTMPAVDLADAIVAIWKSLRRNDEDTAYRISFPLGAIVALELQAGLDGFLAIEKHLLVKRGILPSARRRRPYAWELDVETAAEVDRLFERLMRMLNENR